MEQRPGQCEFGNQKIAGFDHHITQEPVGPRLDPEVLVLGSQLLESERFHLGLIQHLDSQRGEQLPIALVPDLQPESAMRREYSSGEIDSHGSAGSGSDLALLQKEGGIANSGMPRRTAWGPGLARFINMSRCGLLLGRGRSRQAGRG